MEEDEREKHKREREEEFKKQKRKFGYSGIAKAKKRVVKMTPIKRDKGDEEIAKAEEDYQREMSEIRQNLKFAKIDPQSYKDR